MMNPVKIKTFEQAYGFVLKVKTCLIFGSEKRRLKWKQPEVSSANRHFLSLAVDGSIIQSLREMNSPCGQIIETA
jgi:hypothetical protein